MNNSRVIPARLIGAKATGAAIEIVLLRDRGDDVWECLTRPGRKMKTGAEVFFGENGELKGTVIDEIEGGNRLIKFDYDGIFLEVLDKLGNMPLPPYIHEKLEDKERYQTVYSKESGSAAAPTAGLHFTNERMPKVGGAGREMDKVYVSRDVDAALSEAEQLAERMKDEYVSVEHLFLAIL